MQIKKIKKMNLNTKFEILSRTNLTKRNWRLDSTFKNSVKLIFGGVILWKLLFKISNLGHKRSCWQKTRELYRKIESFCFRIYVSTWTSYYKFINFLEYQLENHKTTSNHEQLENKLKMYDYVSDQPILLRNQYMNILGKSIESLKLEISSEKIQKFVNIFV